MEEIEAPLNPVPPSRTPNNEAAATPRSNVQNDSGNANGNGGPAYPMAGEPNGERAPADPEAVQEEVPAKKPAMALGGAKGKWGNLKKVVVNAPDADQGANASENAPGMHLSQEDVEVKRGVFIEPTHIHRIPTAPCNPLLLVDMHYQALFSSDGDGAGVPLGRIFRGLCETRPFTYLRRPSRDPTSFPWPIPNP